jgi:UrcA family protein
MPNANCVKSVLFLAVAGTLAASGSALAQSSPYSNGPPESVTVEAPRLHADTGRLNGPLERASLSMAVRYDDLNLLTNRGARILRWRIWRTANEVCDRLADVYPVHQLATDKPCARTAYDDAMVKAYGAISDLRVSYRYGY